MIMYPKKYDEMIGNVSREIKIKINQMGILGLKNKVKYSLVSLNSKMKTKEGQST